MVRAVVRIVVALIVTVVVTAMITSPRPEETVVEDSWVRTLSDTEGVRSHDLALLVDVSG